MGYLVLTHFHFSRNDGDGILRNDNGYILLNTHEEHTRIFASKRHPFYPQKQIVTKRTRVNIPIPLYGYRYDNMKIRLYGEKRQYSKLNLYGYLPQNIKINVMSVVKDNIKLNLSGKVSESIQLNINNLRHRLEKVKKLSKLRKFLESVD